MTLDVDYGEFPNGVDPLQSYSLILDTQAATSAYQKLLDTDLRWPEETATKLSRMFSLAPFQDDNIAFIKQQLPVFEKEFRGTHQTVALAVLDRVAAAIDSGQDQLGFTRYEVPRRTFVAELTDFQTRYSQLLQVLKDWDSVIVAAHKLVKPSQSQLDKVSNAYFAGTQNAATLQANIDTIFTQTNQLEQQVAAREPLIGQRLQADKEAFDDAVSHQGDAAKIRLGAKIISTAAAILPVATPVALGISVAVSASGEVVASHQTGDQVDVQALVLSIPESLQKAQEFRTKFNTAKQSWDKFHSAQDDYNTAPNDDAKKKAADRRSQGLSEFGTNVSDLFKGLSLPTAPQLKMDDFQKQDGELQKLLKETEDLRAQQTGLLTDLSTNKKALETLLTSQLELVETRNQMLQVDAHNDPDGVRLESLAWTIRQRIIGSIAYESAILVRAYRYHTTKYLDSPIGDKYFWTVYTPNRPQVSQDAKPSDYFFTGGSADELNTELQSQETDLKNALDTLYADAQNGYSSYKLGIVAWQEAVTGFHFDCSRDDVRCHFLKSINAEIARQIVAIRNNVTPTSQSIIIPVAVQGTHSQRPNRLIDASVTAKYKNVANMGGNTILMSVIHPITGRVDLDNVCYWVDFRHFGATSNEQEFTSTCADTGVCTRLSSLSRKDYEEETSQLVFMPFRTAYSLKIDVQDSQKGAIPVLTELKIDFHILD